MTTTTINLKNDLSTIESKINNGYELWLHQAKDGIKAVNGYLFIFETNDYKEDRDKYKVKMTIKRASNIISTYSIKQPLTDFVPWLVDKLKTKNNITELIAKLNKY